MNETNGTLFVETSFTYELLLYVFGIPLALFMIVINIVLITVVAKNPSLQIKAMNVIISWTLADLIMALILLSRVAVGSSLWSYEHNKFQCNLWNVSLLFPLITCFTHVLILAMCRFVAVNMRLYYEDQLSTAKLRSYISLCWIYSICISAIPLVWHKEADDGIQCSIFLLPRSLVAIYLGLHFIPSLLIAAVLFARMFHTISRHKRQVHVTTTLTEQKLDEDVELARSCLCTCALYVCCWAPFMIVQVIWIVYGVTKTIQIITLIFLYIGMIASALKPFVWVYRHQHIRVAAKELFYRDQRAHSIVITRACASC